MVALMYWLLTGISPWPFVVLSEAGGLACSICTDDMAAGFGCAIAAVSGRRSA